MKSEIDPRGVIVHANNPGQTDCLFRVSLKAVIFNKKGEVLVVKESDRDWWDIPGGGMDHGETIKSALKRELHEEVGFTGDFTFKTILAEDPTILEPKGIYQMRITFLVEPDSMNFSPGVEADEIAFVDHNVYKDSELHTEQRIYEYCELAL